MANAWDFQGKGYIGPEQMGECPYVFTGNANDDWHDFFYAAWQFAKWASTQDISGIGPSCTFSVNGLSRYGKGMTQAQIEAAYYQNEKEVADGITICLTEAGWASDVVMHWHELLGMLPSGYPDGELDIRNNPNEDPHGERIILHLWHD